jgi:hypothetical protein
MGLPDSCATKAQFHLPLLHQSHGVHRRGARRTHPIFPLNHTWQPQRRALIGIGMTSGQKNILEERDIFA